MNKKGSLISELGFYAAFFFLFFAGWGYFLAFIGQSQVEPGVFFEDLEKSVIVNRVISCLSSENFGDIDKNRINEDELRSCFGSSYNLRLNLDKGDEQDFVFLGDVGVDSKGSGRFILVDGERARLRVSYSKNEETD